MIFTGWFKWVDERLLVGCRVIFLHDSCIFCCRNGGQSIGGGRIFSRTCLVGIYHCTYHAYELLGRVHRGHNLGVPYPADMAALPDHDFGTRLSECLVR